MRNSVLFLMVVIFSTNIYANDEELSYWEQLKAKASMENIKEKLHEGKEKIKKEWHDNNISERVDSTLYDVAQKINITKRENQIVGAMDRHLPNFDIVNQAKMGVHASSDILRATIVTNKEMRIMANASVKKLDAESRVAPNSNKYALRLKEITKHLKVPDKFNLDLKVYIDKTINAFAFANGSVRVYSGLMDKMSNSEILFVIGHELGHVKYKHSKDSYRMAYLMSGLRKGTVAQGGFIGSIAGGVVGKLTTDLVNAKFSRNEERTADEYGVKLLRLNGLNREVAISALKKLSSSNSNLLSSHPSSSDRIEEIEERVKSL